MYYQPPMQYSFQPSYLPQQQQQQQQQHTDPAGPRRMMSIWPSGNAAAAQGGDGRCVQPATAAWTPADNMQHAIPMQQQQQQQVLQMVYAAGPGGQPTLMQIPVGTTILPASALQQQQQQQLMAAPPTFFISQNANHQQLLQNASPGTMWAPSEAMRCGTPKSVTDASSCGASTVFTLSLSLPQQQQQLERAPSSGIGSQSGSPITLLHAGSPPTPPAAYPLTGFVPTGPPPFCTPVIDSTPSFRRRCGNDAHPRPNLHEQMLQASARRGRRTSDHDRTLRGLTPPLQHSTKASAAAAARRQQQQQQHQSSLVSLCSGEERSYFISQALSVLHQMQSVAIPVGPGGGAQPQLLLCSVSLGRLQEALEKRMPVLYKQVVKAGSDASGSGVWKTFVVSVLKLRCFRYSARDYQRHPSLACHITPTDMRCASPEAPQETTRNDARVGELLWSKYLRWEYLLPTCLQIIGDCIQDRSLAYGVPAFVKATTTASSTPANSLFSLSSHTSEEFLSRLLFVPTAAQSSTAAVDVLKKVESNGAARPPPPRPSTITITPTALQCTTGEDGDAVCLSNNSMGLWPLTDGGASTVSPGAQGIRSDDVLDEAALELYHQVTGEPSAADVLEGDAVSFARPISVTDNTSIITPVGLCPSSISPVPSAASTHRESARTTLSADDVAVEAHVNQVQHRSPGHPHTTPETEKLKLYHMAKEVCNNLVESTTTPIFSAASKAQLRTVVESILLYILTHHVHDGPPSAGTTAAPAADVFAAPPSPTAEPAVSAMKSKSDKKALTAAVWRDESEGGYWAFSGYGYTCPTLAKALQGYEGLDYMFLKVAHLANLHSWWSVHAA